jgi:hypothetical protein
MVRFFQFEPLTLNQARTLNSPSRLQRERLLDRQRNADDAGLT